MLAHILSHGESEAGVEKLREAAAEGGAAAPGGRDGLRLLLRGAIRSRAVGETASRSPETGASLRADQHARRGVGGEESAGAGRGPGRGGLDARAGSPASGREEAV